MDSLKCLPSVKSHELYRNSSQNRLCFLGEILVESKSYEEDRFKLVIDCLTKFDADNL